MRQNSIAILSTGPLDDSLIDVAKQSNINVDVLSFIETRPATTRGLKEEIKNIFHHPAVVVFTSMNAVKLVAAELDGQLPRWRIYTVGSGTARLIEKYFGENCIAGIAHSAIELAGLIIEQGIQDEVIFFCGDQRRSELPDILKRHHARVREIVVYNTIALQHPVTTPYDGVMFYSPSGVDSFFSKNETIRQAVYFAIGDTTAAAAKKYTGNLVVVAKKPGKQNLFKKMMEYFETPVSDAFVNSRVSGKTNNASTGTLTNDLLLRALAGKEVERPPVWMMRQAGRYLPDYIRIREKYDFFTRCQTPELATKITLQPVDQVGVDAAIIFSDILVIPQAMGVEVLMEESKGPSIPRTICTQMDIDALITADVEERLKYVFDAISLTKKELNGRVPLIGFAGAPWTILCYLVEGKGSKTWDRSRQFLNLHPGLAHQLLEKITAITIDYLKGQATAGADAVQVFDSWSGVLSPSDFAKFARPYLFQIADALKDQVPVILFPKGSWYALKDISESAASGVGIDWCTDPQFARQVTGDRITLQGNFDPSRLLMPIPDIKRSVKEMIDAFGPQRYIANLGHGITPNVPVDHAKAFVDAVKEYRPS